MRRNPAGTPSQQWSDYARRRFLRIYPLYVATLTACYFATSQAPWSADALSDLGIHAALLHTLIPGHVNLINPSLWSLAVEAQLYALYPLVWLGMRRFGASRVLLLCAALSLAWRFGLPLYRRSFWGQNLPWRWGFEWFLGVGVAHALAAKRWPGGLAVRMMLASCAALLAPSRSPILYGVAPPLVFAALVGWAARRRVPLPAYLRPLTALGGVSYALYLIHQPMLTQAAKRLDASGVRLVDAAPFAATSIAALLVCAAVATVLERWGRRAQRLHDPSRERALRAS